MKIVCGLLNMSPPITQNGYVIITKNLSEDSENVVESSMKRVIEEVKPTQGTEVTYESMVPGKGADSCR